MHPEQVQQSQFMNIPTSNCFTQLITYVVTTDYYCGTTKGKTLHSDTVHTFHLAFSILYQLLVMWLSPEQAQQ